MTEKPGYTPVSIFAAACGAAAKAIAVANPVTAPVAAGIGATVSAVAGGIELNGENRNVKESLDQAMEKAWARIDTDYRMTLYSNSCLSELKREIMGKGTSVDEFIRNEKDKGVWPSITIVIASILKKHRESLNKDPAIVWNDEYTEKAAAEMASILEADISGVFGKEDQLRVLMAIAEGEKKNREAVADSEKIVKKTVLCSEKKIIEAVDDSAKKMEKALVKSENRIIEVLRKQNQDTTFGGISSLPVGKSDTESSPDVIDFLMVRQLANGLFVNWKTGCLAGNFRAALDGRDGAGNALPTLSPSQLRLLSVLVQGEGAVVSWRNIFQRGKLLSKWQEKYVGTDPTAGVMENLSSEMIQREPTQEEIEEISIISIIELQNRIREAVGRIGVVDSEAARDILREAETKKGFRIELFQDKTKVREMAGDIRKSLFSGNGDCESYTEYDDFTLLTDEMEGGHTRCREVSAWLRRYYDKACRFFENRVSNKGDEDTNSSEKEIFGDYTMVQAYMIPYVSIGEDRQNEGQLRQKKEKTRQDVIIAKDIYEIAPETMLDYVERWHSEEGYPGRVLVLHGQPGDGKTTFCRKAVYAHCREGWLADTPHVFRFSLNPADNEIIEESSIHFENAFSIYDEEGQRFPLSLRDLKNMPRGNGRENMLQGSLIILDGYDELAGSMGNRSVSIAFMGFYNNAVKFAEKHKCNVIITSRTMCIENDLKGSTFRDYKKAPVAAFAPLTEVQQDAMIDRMIELDAPKELEEAASVDSFSPERKRKENDRQNRPKTLEEYRDKVLKKLRESRDEKLNDFKELLKVPLLFRMIVNSRFEKFEGAGTVAELYGQLFYHLLDQKDGVGRKEVNKQTLVRDYEDIAVRVFNYDGDTCPFSVKKDVDKKELV